jgi:hypothetical protein
MAHALSLAQQTSFNALWSDTALVGTDPFSGKVKEWNATSKQSQNLSLGSGYLPADAADAHSPPAKYTQATVEPIQLPSNHHRLIIIVRIMRYVVR